jgi:UDP-N-acetylglucosamine 3-dehydrogenase
MRVGILGLGSAGVRHFRAFRKIPDISVVGADLDEKRRAPVEAEGGTTVMTLESLLSSRPEAVVVAVPHASLADAALQALEAGAHVLLEKPMATSLEDAMRVVNRARVLERRVMVSFVHRFRPDVAAARDLIARGEIGSPVFLTDLMASGASEMPPWVWDRARAGGGMMLYNGIHQVDRARFLLGEEVDTVRAEVRTLAHAVDTEDTVTGLLGFRSRAVGVVAQHKAAATAMPVWETQVFGTKGSLRIRTGQELSWVSEGTSATLPGIPEDRFYGAAVEFVAAIQEDRAPSPSGEDGVAALEVVLRMYADGAAIRAKERSL